ncbi:MAG: hypothetical protein ACSHWZ_17215 [Sulfitobacter sp.]
MTHIQAITATGQCGTLGYWRQGASRDVFDPSMHPRGDFKGRMARTKLHDQANANEMPMHGGMQRYGGKVVPLRRA